MKRCVVPIFLIMFVLASLTLPAQEPYELPHGEVVQILDAPPTPRVSMSPDRETMLLIEYESMPTIAHVSMPILRIAGMRITPHNNSCQVLSFNTGLTLKTVRDGKVRKVGLPAGIKFTGGAWSDDGKWIALTRYLDNGVELWVVDAISGQAKALTPPRLNIVMGGIVWMPDNKRILVQMIPDGRGPAPVEARVPIGPTIQESGGKQTKVATYQDLLKNPFDEALFSYYATGQIALVDVMTGQVQKVGTPGIYASSSPSADFKYLLVTRITLPFSYSVPYFGFARSYEVWDMTGKQVKLIANLPPTEDVPMNGVPLGPRSVNWQALKPATLVWTEALDGGDPEKSAPYRDEVMVLTEPFSGEPREALKTQHRFAGLTWFASPGLAFASESDWKRRWRTTWLVTIDDPSVAPRKIFDLSVQDQYKDPGSPVMINLGGDRVALQENDWIYLSGMGASPQGDHPFLDKMNLKTNEKQRLFQCAEGKYQSFVCFPGASRDRIIVTHESKSEVPNYYLYDLASRKMQALSDFKDPAPQLTGIKKELIKYKREDGVDLSGTLYLPPGYKEGQRLPVVVWAYPLECSGAYNRTLTPFGFQSERRTLWEARDTYINMSPFMHADKINEPILLRRGR